MLNAVQTGTPDRRRRHRARAPRRAAMARAAADEALRRPAGRGGRPRRGPRHVRHRQLPAGLRPGAGARDRRACPGPTPWSSTWTSTWGSAPTTRPASSAGSASASWSRPSPGGLLRRGAGRRRGRVPPLRRPAAPAPARPVLPRDGGERAPGLQRPAGGRLRRPPATSRWSSSRRPAGAQQVNEGHFPGLDAVPTHAITVTIPALLRAGAGAGHRPRGAQGRAGARPPSPARSPRLPGLGAADDHPRHHPSRARLGAAAPD